ncbi:hypothetical protein MRS44_000354 [Fusarium solani]|uniref:uncharacterized protein n=1 Tax=Fusarium solani TaxID=169388 RepID=UPI0032C440BC|nr:hypothetical protein MRS44_000354 [Fusarium solani]
MTLPPTQATPPTDCSSLLIWSARIVLQESPINSSRQFVPYFAVATVPKMTVRTTLICRQIQQRLLSMHPRMDMDLAVTDHPALAGLISYASAMGMNGMAWSGMVWYGCGQTSPIVERSKYVCMVRSEPGQAS